MYVIGNIISCRICLLPQVQSDTPYEMFDKNHLRQSETLAEIFETLTSIHVTPNDGLPNIICRDCEAKLMSAFSFRQECIDADHKIRLRYVAVETRAAACPSPSVDYKFTHSPLIIEQYEEKCNQHSIEENEQQPKSVQLQEHLPIECERASAKTFECDICSRTFNVRSKIAQHMRSHITDLEYKCTFCDAGRSFSFSLVDHQNVAAFHFIYFFFYYFPLSSIQILFHFEKTLSHPYGN